MRASAESPFSPGKPVSQELFAGRKDEISKIDQLLRQTAGGRQENIFIQGERGIGKSSLAHMAGLIAETQYNMASLQIMIGGVSSIEEMLEALFQKLAEETQSNAKLFEKIKALIGADRVKSVGLFGVSVEFKKQELKSLANSFLPAMERLCLELKQNDKNGLILVLDDVNGLCETGRFPDFIKSFVDAAAVSKRKLPLMLVIVGTAERWRQLNEKQPSFGRIFHLIRLEPFSAKESELFLRHAFKSVAMDVDPDALEIMAKYSGGYPMLLHEIGDAVFFASKDDRISWDDALLGLGVAAENFGRKYIDDQAIRAIRSETYAKILAKISDQVADLDTFHTGDIGGLDEQEKKVLNNFLQRMKKLGVLRSEQAKGTYSFANPLYPLYFILRSKL